jgi:Zn-dependent metalloprotease
MKKFNSIFVLLILSCLIFSIDAQQGSNKSNEIDFEKAFIRLENWGGSPYEIRFKEGSNVDKSVFFQKYKNYFGLSDDYQFEQLSEFSDQLYQTHYRYNLYFKGIQVNEAQFILHEKNGIIHYANGHLVHGLEVDISPLITEQTALQAAINHLGADSYMWEDEANELFLQKEKEDPNATYYPIGELKLTAGRKKLSNKNIRLVYRFNIFTQQPSGNYYVDVDAETGEIVNTIDLIETGDALGQGLTLYNGPVQITTDSVVVDTFRLRESGRGNGIQTFNMQNNPDLNAFDQAIDFIDDDNNFTEPYDQAGVSVHWALEGTYDYYLSKHGRDSFDGAGGLVKAYAHTGDGWANAQWLSSLLVMRFGDGGGSWVPIDVVGHEFTHGVDQFSSNLIYQGESGALDESFADIFGTLVEFDLEGPGGGDWLVAEDRGTAIRSMENPNAFGDPDTYFGIGWASLTGGDNGGVHTNSGVQNYWFYLLTEGGTGTNDNGDDYSVTGIGLEDAAKIAYRNRTVYLIPSSGYFDAHLGSINAAADLFGTNSQQYISTVEAWDAVGVYYPFIGQTVDVSPDPVDFEQQVNSIPDTIDVVISNFGLQPLIIDNIQVSGTHFEITSSPAMPIELTDLLDNFEISIVFTPTDTGLVNETLSIFSNDPVNPNKSVPLNGIGYELNEAFTGVLYSSTGLTENGKILTLDLTSGAGTGLGESNFDELSSLTISPNSNIIYGISSNDSSTIIVRVNATGGDAWSLYTLNLGDLTGIAFDSSGTLYASQLIGNIYSIDLINRDYSFVTTVNGLTSVLSMTINQITNEVWVVPNVVIGAKDKVYTLDLTTGDATLVGQTGFNKLTNDMAFDENGNLYGVIGGSSEEGQLIMIDTNDGSGSLVGNIGFQNVVGLAYSINGDPSSIENDNDSNVPSDYSLAQNYPNPFNPSTSIEFSVPVNSDVTIRIYNLLGEVVTTLVNEEISTGNHSVAWNGNDEGGNKVSSGIYFYEMKANGNNGSAYSQIKKMVLLK